MCLQAQSPLRVLQAIADGGLDIVPAGFAFARVHWLQQKVLEVQIDKIIGGEVILWVDEF